MSKTLADILRSYIPDGDGYNSEYAHNLNAAADALESQQSAQTGYVLVPVEPSEKMLDILYHNGPGLDDHLLATIWAELLAAAPSAPATVQGDGWIPVSERLPNIVQEVIVNSKFDGITAGFLDSYGEWYSPNSDYKLTRVVAWQPLPAPPAIADAPKAEQPPVQEPLAQYDAGLLNDFGGGNVEWWQDYLRAELGRAHDFYQSQIAIAAPQPVSDDALMSAVEDVIDHLNGGFSIHSGQGLHSCLEAAYRAAMESNGDE